MEEERLDERGEIQDETEPLLRPESPPTYLLFRLGREPQQASRFTAFVLSVFKVTFCSLGLWGHQTWNYIPRVVFSAICIFPAVCWLYEDTSNFNRIPRQDDRNAEKACFTLLSLAALLSYVIFIGCFIAARRKDSALVSPSETIMLDIQKTDTSLLFLAFVFIIISFLSSLALSYKTEPTSIPLRFGGRLKFEETAVVAQFLTHWASVNTCHVFAVSSFTLSTYAQDTLRLIWEVQNGTLDDVIRIHENLCTVVFNTVSAYSIWFLLHWFTYGASIIVDVIYLSEEVTSSVKYHIPSMDLVLLALIFVCLLYLFVVPCFCAARITSSCAGIYEKINCTTSDDWNEGHPFKDRHNIFLFVSYAKNRHCGFQVGRITFDTSLTWVSFLLGLTAMLFHFL